MGSYLFLRVLFIHPNGSFYAYKLRQYNTLLFFQSLSHIRLFATPWTATWEASLSFIISLSLLNLLSIELVIPCNHLILCHLLLIPPSIFPSIRAFSNEQALCIKWLKYWSFSFSISSSSEYSGLISLDWLSKGSQKSSLATQIWYAQCVTTHMIVWVNMLHDRQAKTKHTHFLLWLWWSKWN